MQKETVPAESSAHHKNREIPTLKEKKKSIMSIRWNM